MDKLDRKKREILRFDKVSMHITHKRIAQGAHSEAPVHWLVLLLFRLVIFFADSACVIIRHYIEL